MAQYSTPPGECSQGGHEITDSPSIANVGYVKPKSGPVRDRLCKEHYLAAFAEAYPGVDPPQLDKE